MTLRCSCTDLRERKSSCLPKNVWNRKIFWLKFINHAYKFARARRFLVDALAKHVTIGAVAERFAGTGAGRLRDRKLDRHLRYRRSLPLKALETVPVRAIALHRQRLVRVHRKKFIYVRQRPLDGAVIGETASPHVDFLLMIFPGGDKINFSSSPNMFATPELTFSCTQSTRRAFSPTRSSCKAPISLRGNSECSLHTSRPESRSRPWLRSRSLSYRSSRS